MSSIPTNVAKRGDKGSPSGKSSAEKAGAKIAPQTELQSHLEKTAKFIKAFDILVRIFAWLACMLAAWLLACIVDHWLLPIPTLLRWAIWLALVGFTGWIVIRQIVPLLVGRINLDYAARRIEHSEPRFKEGLIAWLQLSNMPDAGVPRGVMAALTYRAYRFIGGQDPSSTVDSSPLIRGLAGFLVLACVMALYSFVSPKSSLATGLRIAMPWRSTAPPTRVQLSDIEPGSETVSAGKPLEVSVRATGVRNDEPVRLIFSTLDGQIVEGVVNLTEPDVGYIYTGQLRTTPTGVEHKLQYWIEAGDAVSDKYNIDLAPAPSVVLERVELVYPAYTGLAKQISDGRAIEAVEGTQATIVARSNQELTRGQLEINPTHSANGQLEKADRLVQMQIDGRELKQDWPLLIGPDGISPEEMHYSVRGFNARGDSNLNPILHSLSVVADVAPDIRLVGPKSRVLRVRPKTRMQLEIRASDPDFGLNEIELSVHKEGSSVASRKILVGDGLKGQQVKRQPLDIGRLSMQPGQRLELHATARDNRHDPRTGKWSPNETHADPLIIEVVGPQEPADVSENPQADDEASDGSQGDKGDGTEQSGANGQSGSQSGPNGQTGESPSGEQGPQDSQPGNSQSGQQNNDSQNPDTSNNSGASGENQQGNSDSGDAQEQSGGQQSESEQAGSTQTGASGGQSSTGSASESGDPSGGSGQSGDQTGGGEESSGSQSSSGGNKSDSGSQDGASKPNGGDSNNNAGGESQSPSSAASPSANRRSGNNARAGAGGTSASDADAMKQIEDFMRENPPENRASQTGEQSQQQPSGKPDSSQRPKGDARPSDTQSSDSQPSDTDGPSKGNSGADGNSKQPQDGQNSPANDQPGQEQSASEGNTKNPQSKSAEENAAENAQNTQQGSTPNNPDKPSNDNPSGSQGQNAGDQQDGSGKSGDGKQGNQTSPGEQSKSGSQSESGNKQSDSAPEGGEQSSDGSEGQDAGGENANSESSASPGSQGKSKPGEGQQSKGESGPAGKPGDSSQSTGEQSGGKQSAGEKGDGKQGASEQQSSKQSDSEKGSGKPGESNGGSEQAGKKQGGEASAGGKKGDEQQAGGQAKENPNKTSGEKGSESQSQKQSGQPGENASKSGSQPASSEQSKPQSQAGGPPGSSKPGNNTGQVGNPSGSSNTGSSNRDGGGPGSSEAADREAAERAADLVLDYLDRQRDQPDPDLLREVNWDKNDLNNFVDRWKQARQLASQGDDDAQQKWKELLTELQLGPGRGGSLGPMKRSDNFQQMSDSATRMEPPKALLKRWEAVQRALKKR